jgi:hypothetical protein
LDYPLVNVEGEEKMNKIFFLSVATAILVTLTLVFTPQAVQSLSSASDPTDDLYYYGSGSPAPTWTVIDIVYSGVSQVNSTHVRLLTKAAQTIPLTNNFQSFYWLLDTGVSAPPWSNPPDSNDLTVSYYVGVSWSASGPLWIDVNKINSTGQYSMFNEDARSHPETYFSGDTCSITIPLSLIGNPTSIKCVAGNSDGVSGGKHDKAPNTGHMTLSLGPFYVFDVTWGLGMGPFNVTVFCNHAVTSFNFKPGEPLSFVIVADNSGFCNVTISRNRVDSSFNITADESPTIYSMTQNATNSILSFAYSAGSHSIRITGTERGYIIGDVNGDGKVDIIDIAIVARNYGHKEEDYDP